MKSVLKFVALGGLFYSLVVSGARAATTHSVSPLHPIFDSGKPKLVKFRVQSDLKIPIDLRLGESPTTLQPGQSIAVRLPVGSQIIVGTAIAGHPAGEVIVRVESLLDDAVVHIKS